MADKEPRRRKKRKDGQRKDDIRSEDLSFMSQKSDSRDSDQETEEEFVVPIHQPSKIAKVVFVLLFSGLVVSMSFVFLSLQGAERGPTDVFDGNHVEEHVDDHDVVSQNIHDDAQAWNAVDTSHDESEDLPGLGSILTFNNEQVRNEEAYNEPNLNESPSDESDGSNDFEVSSEDLQDHSNRQELQSEYPEETFVPEEFVSEDIPPLEYFTEMPPEEAFRKKSADNDIQHTTDSYHSSSFAPEEIDSFLEAPVEVSFSASSDFVNIPDEFQSATTEDVANDDIHSPELFDDMKEDFSLYEKSDITNQADFEIRDKVDNVDKVLEKESLQDDDDDDDDDDEIEDEFDFWQF